MRPSAQWTWLAIEYAQPILFTYANASLKSLSMYELNKMTLRSISLKLDVGEPDVKSRA